MKLKLQLLPLVLLVVLQPVLAATPVEKIKGYIKATYGETLELTGDQVEQLSWVLDNPVATPEIATPEIATPEMASLGYNETIHREVPRALSRLYCLQLLRSGSNADYQSFIKPQTGEGGPKLNKDSFTSLSKRMVTLDDESYQVLQAAAIISSVSLSPQAKTRAAKVINSALPDDSVRFLSDTAPEAARIYPLAAKVIKQYPSAAKKFEIVFLPDSHLRHMMYNEGSLDMYSTIRKGVGDGSLKKGELDLWYDRWIINIAGFRGHITPMGSLYLGQRTYMAMNQVKLALDRMLKDRKVNPMALYLQKRANWLYLSNLSKSPQERVALASLAASMRLFTTPDGKQLFSGFRALSATDQRRWLSHVEHQQSIQNTPSPTYAPAVLANALNMSDIRTTVTLILPVLLDAYELAYKLRKAGVMKNHIPLSFRKLAQTAVVEKILNAGQPVVVDINPDNGVATLK